VRRGFGDVGTAIIAKVTDGLLRAPFMVPNRAAVPRRKAAYKNRHEAARHSVNWSAMSGGYG
jgi:hypothetical protein